MLKQPNKPISDGVMRTAKDLNNKKIIVHPSEQRYFSVEVNKILEELFINKYKLAKSYKLTGTEKLVISRAAIEAVRKVNQMKTPSKVRELIRKLLKK